MDDFCVWCKCACELLRIGESCRCDLLKPCDDCEPECDGSDK